MPVVDLIMYFSGIGISVLMSLLLLILFYYGMQKGLYLVTLLVGVAFFFSIIFLLFSHLFDYRPGIVAGGVMSNIFLSIVFLRAIHKIRHLKESVSNYSQVNRVVIKIPASQIKSMEETNLQVMKSMKRIHDSLDRVAACHKV